MPNQFEGNFTITPTKKIAIVVGKFNESVTRNLADGAVRTLKQFGINDDQIDLVWVPGAFEIAFAVKNLVASGNYAGVMTLGAVIKGETDHYDLICQSTSAIMNLNAQGTIPVTFGILTTDTIEQAMQRAGLKVGNEGSMTAQSLLEMISLNEQLG
ncbi:6,7-dimethyl-8-ribityllumazine synthase [Limosilactobacillus fermentum]|uniref:6,7-dimethyl-8-ribityllumazine synthase n=1 Tax=Limosilactobacillus fermentum TaxID=1613 RepID=UPI00186BA243|nr:6,7-dimethyl-8-ribityllumazine synthase [Limosilactobacillus fermentum]MBE4710151.1 6,7-dimethyl-8-ribityllumazine synthase [Limosilactobacillus fermentum]